MRHHHDGLSKIVDCFAHEVENFSTRMAIEVSRWFIGEDDRRTGYERPGHGDTLLLTTGKLRGPVGETVRKPHGGNHRLQPIGIGSRPASMPGRVMFSNAVRLGTRL